MWQSCKQWLFGWLFPLQCLGCKSYDQWICAQCLTLPAPPIYQGHVYALSYYHQPILKAAIHQLKYAGSPGIAEPLGRALVKRIPTNCYDLVIPVPLHWQRRWQRGYNQTQLLAQQFPKPVWTILQKRRRTKSQATLNRADRQTNLQNAFSVPEAYRQLITGQRVLLIDDVYSTGATTEACTAALRAAGASQVLIGVVALNVKMTT